MLTFSSEIHVKQVCNRQAVLSMMNQWFLSSGLSKRWLTEKPHSPFDVYEGQAEFSEEVSGISVEITDDAAFLLVQMKTDETSFFRNTFCIFRDQEDTPVCYVGESLDAKKFGSAFSVQSAGIYARELVQYVFWNDYQEQMDGGIENSDRTVFLTGSNLQSYLPVLTGTGLEHVKPFLYIPYQATDVIQRFERPFVGQLHILAEGTPLIAGKIQDFVKENPGEALPADSLILKWPDGIMRVVAVTADVLEHTDEIVDKVQMDLQDVLSENPPDERFVIAHLREQKLLSRLSGDPDMSAVFDSILSDKDQEIALLKQNAASLKKELYDEKAKVLSLQNSHTKTESEEASGMFVTEEVPKYEHEFEDIILRVLEKERDGMSGDTTLEGSRKYHVLCDILAHNFPSETGTGLKTIIKDVFAAGRLTRDGIGRLSSSGFTVEKNDRQAHYRIAWQGDDRYVCTYSATASDYRSGKNAASNYTNLCFGY